MPTIVRQGRVVGLLTVVLTLGHLISGMAEPSPACRTLAKQFAETPEKLGADHLYRLQTCVHRELSGRGIDGPNTDPTPMPKMPRVPGLGPTPAPG
jgi:hypothetical protein